jgi:protein involved in polysaccharide export with SLBB domain
MKLGILLLGLFMSLNLIACGPKELRVQEIQLSSGTNNPKTAPEEFYVIGSGQVRKLLEEKYKEFTASPFVTLRVEAIASSEVFLVGQVAKPGAYPLMGNDTLLQLLTRAGGLSIFADRRNVRVVRRDGDKIVEYTIDYDAIIGGDLKQDILLRPGDRIIAP